VGLGVRGGSGESVVVAQLKILLREIVILARKAALPGFALSL
jgi:hypothetical protein